MTTDFSKTPVTRDQIETAIKLFLFKAEPGFEIKMVHPDGTSKYEITVSMYGSDNIQAFLLNLAIVASDENAVNIDGEILPDKESITETFYGYASKIKQDVNNPELLSISLPFEPDLFSVLMSDPSLGFMD